MKEECGVFAINYYNDNVNIIEHTIKGLEKLQHRGQDSAGVSYIDSNKIQTFKNTGLVKDVFQGHNLCCTTNMTIGHVRYTTSNSASSFACIQPITENHPKLGAFSIAHNGHIHNLDKTDISKGYTYESDTDFIKEFIKSSNLDTWEDILIDVMNKIPGIYSLVMLTADSIYAMRDRFGMRPLQVGMDKLGYYISSESCAFTNVDKLLDIDPGQIIKIKDNIYNIYTHPPENLRCIFEYIYFSSKNSTIDYNNISDIRFTYGKYLAKQDVHFFNKDAIVVGSPNSGILAGKGYAEESKLQYKQLLIKNPNYNRSFIMPDQESRQKVCNNKFKIDIETHGDIKGKTVILVDDSIVRGNTIKSIVNIFNEAGVTNLHIRSASPQLKHPCYFGIDLPTYDELIANKIPSYTNFARFLGVLTVDYLSLKNLLEAMKTGNKTLNYCTGCFDGKYNSKLLDW